MFPRGNKSIHHLPGDNQSHHHTDCPLLHILQILYTSIGLGKMSAGMNLHPLLLDSPTCHCKYISMEYNRIQGTSTSVLKWNSPYTLNPCRTTIFRSNVRTPSINPAEPANRKDYSKISIFAYFYPFMPPLMIFGQNLINADQCQSEFWH